MHIEVTAALEAFCREPVEDPEARANRALRAVLECGGVSKIGKDAVPHHPSDEAVVVLDDARAQGNVGLDKAAQVIELQAFGKCGGAHQIAKHHCDLAPFALHGSLPELLRLSWNQ